MVGYGWKSSLVFYDSNESVNTELQAVVREKLQLEAEPAIVENTLEEERKLIGEHTGCKHRCKHPEHYKHLCCKAGHKKKAAGNLNRLQYTCWILNNHIEPTLRSIHTRRNKLILLKDNDASYGIGASTSLPALFKDFLKRTYEFDVLANAARSPDLNVIKNVWRMIKSRLKECKVTSTEEMKATIIHIWEKEIEQSSIDRIIDTMQERL
ncbi:hypothetical protein BAUCODRAFT_348266 [Baudoinia panamericana UAMH 10762]|uniref:Tc1-like transposase DDE domain-containing protein n=1 Tax=Baudoinia panamericana (strain UAMH 10762) TaxID=717646 RepID=M2N6M3_BAUPA|nr:uncharacterized protein BAUCODRAFT_348266 [Baudoinia panamericana UAMH 10762]EMC99733.1 hypothetical protein BAUCODRAFT_348266 [Baudoinia panamericana UAMH 10762]